MDNLTIAIVITIIIPTLIIAGHVFLGGRYG